MDQRTRYRPPLDVKAEDPPECHDHTHQQSPGLLIKVLSAVTVVLLITVGWLLWTTYRLQMGQSETTAYIEQARDRRDEQNAQLEQGIRNAVCSVLDRFPTGELFDPTRAEYGCGPGIPLEQLSPDAAQDLADIIEQGQAAPAAAVAPEPTTEALPPELDPQPAPGAQIVPSVPPAPAQAVPQPAPTTPAPQPTPVTPAPVAPTTPPPIVDLGPVTDTVCGLLRVCL